MSAEQIAAGLERDRADLSKSIDGLRGKLSADSLISDAMGYARSNMAPYLRALDGAVRANPVAAAMAGAGLAWLILGRKSGASGAEAPLAGTKFEAMSRWEDEGGPVAEMPHPEDSWIATADKLRHSALDALARISAAARVELRPIAEVAAHRAAILADLARATRDAMLHGLENLGAEAQQRILAAREQAYIARLEAVRQGSRLIEERPLVAGALGMALGAAVGAALPHTTTEDRLFGQDRDRLMARARDMLRDERSRAASTASKLADTVTQELKNTAKQRVSQML